MFVCYFSSLSLEVFKDLSFLGFEISLWCFMVWVFILFLLITLHTLVCPFAAWKTSFLQLKRKFILKCNFCTFTFFQISLYIIIVGPLEWANDFIFSNLYSALLFYFMYLNLLYFFYWDLGEYGNNLWLFYCV